eukprot:TRINITY_DN5712_c0_g1_i2.p1 TRINITY_DN5712_c0_g1~~TRINITY_DN5712_c0_g1_i2.p1  ORF type:complete len:389 (-),score=44.69 TRINITY_DN5712_c0_g1_i2:129-1295(-)
MTLSNQEIIDIDVGCLSDSGFIFVWVINSQMQFSFECLNRWGYKYVDQITWVKTTKNGNIGIAQGYYFLHSTEICLIGVKGKTDFISLGTTDILFGELREKSQKPDKLYEIIEYLIPGKRRVELFARNHNLREGWVSLGNELGEYYDWGRDRIQCDKCAEVIAIGQTRYKSKKIPDLDLCGKCFEAEPNSQNDFFKLENILEEMIFHQYYCCNGCFTKPIWGIRFHCLECEDVDLCETCYDKKLLLNDCGHTPNHEFLSIEIPELAGGLPVHRERCVGCMTFPIIGYLFVCQDCPNIHLCQKCFFKKKSPKNHLPTHEVELLIDPLEDGVHHSIKCDSCGTHPIVGTRYKCNSCYNYDLCQTCYESNAPPPKNDVAHKPSHKFTKLPA